MEAFDAARSQTTALPPAGWYDDPYGAGRRWWDGKQWTSHHQAPPQRSEGVPPTDRLAGLSVVSGKPRSFYWALLALFAIVIGSLGPWARALIITVNGTDGDGAWFLVACVFIAICLWRYAKSGSRGAMVFPALAGAFIAGDSIYILNRVNEASQTTLFGEQVTIATAGWGLYACILGGGLLFLCSLVLGFSQRVSGESA